MWNRGSAVGCSDSLKPAKHGSSIVVNEAATCWVLVKEFFKVP